jgi:hypothetical protein
MTCTATVPSVFRNAVNERLVPEPDVPSRTAPGLTKRDHCAGLAYEHYLQVLVLTCANAHKRDDGVTVVPEIWMSAELVVPDSMPSQ